MKKLMIFCVAISFIAISGAMVLKSTYEKRWNDPFLIENVEALAQDLCPVCGKYNPSNPCEDCGSETGDGGGGGGGSCGWGVKFSALQTGCSCGITQSKAKSLYLQYGGNWCCNSCSSTWYCCGGCCNYV